MSEVLQERMEVGSHEGFWSITRNLLARTGQIQKLTRSRVDLPAKADILLQLHTSLFAARIRIASAACTTLQCSVATIWQENGTFMAVQTDSYICSCTYIHILCTYIPDILGVSKDILGVDVWYAGRRTEMEQCGLTRLFDQSETVSNMAEVYGNLLLVHLLQKPVKTSNPHTVGKYV